jgi:hypothetical protein
VKVLFISGGNNDRFPLSPIVENQAQALRQIGISVENYTIIGRGILGYISNMPKLKKCIKAGEFDLVHAHYGRSAFLAGLFCREPIVTSLMGSEANASTAEKNLIQFFAEKHWDATIVKLSSRPKKKSDTTKINISFLSQTQKEKRRISAWRTTQ